MKVTLLYLRIVKRVQPELPQEFDYGFGEVRFRETYLKFKPQIPHELVVVNCGAEADDGFFDGMATRYERYDGLGSDCGTYQQIGKQQDSELVIGMNTGTYLWRGNWLEPIVDAYLRNGQGVYGVCASYQFVPHLRTPCIGFHPRIISEYPMETNSRERACLFEYGPGAFALWAHHSGYPSLLVTPTGVYGKDHWRVPANGFRRGDQSDCLVWDRHIDIYHNASPDDKHRLGMEADGK